MSAAGRAAHILGRDQAGEAVSSLGPRQVYDASFEARRALKLARPRCGHTWPAASPEPDHFEHRCSFTRSQHRTHRCACGCSVAR